MLTLIRYLIPEPALQYIDERGLFKEEATTPPPLKISAAKENGTSDVDVRSHSIVDSQIDGVPAKS